MNFKILTLFLGFIVCLHEISAQCYIQFTYDTSGNRTKRETLGCYIVGKGIILDINQQVALQSDSVASSLSGMRKEQFRQDVEGEIRVYPNPSDGFITVHLDKYEPTWTYRLMAMSGQLLQESKVTNHQLNIDISTRPSATYLFGIYDDTGQIIYRTNVIKQ